MTVSIINITLRLDYNLFSPKLYKTHKYLILSTFSK